jgi:Zn-dependent protease with chaperone function
MKQKNNSASILICTVVALIATTAAVAGKITPFITHTFTYCESIVKTLSWQMPPWIVYSLIIMGVSLLFVSLAKCAMVLFHSVLLKKKTIAYSFSNEQNSLLKKLAIEKQMVILDEPAPSAFCFGIFRPKIYISNSLISLLSLEELETILVHEKYHLDHYDTLIMLAIYSVRHFFPFFPLLQDLISNYRIEREIRADQAAISVRGEKDSLISVLKKLLQYDSSIYAFAPALADEETLDARIHALIHADYHLGTFRPDRIIFSVLSILVFSLICFIPVQASEQPGRNAAMMKCYVTNDVVSIPQMNRSVPFSPAR